MFVVLASTVLRGNQKQWSARWGHLIQIVGRRFLCFVSLSPFGVCQGSCRVHRYAASLYCTAESSVFSAIIYWFGLRIAWCIEREWYKIQAKRALVVGASRYKMRGEASTQTKSGAFSAASRRQRR